MNALGLEPKTLGLKGPRSNQLSYASDILHQLTGTGTTYTAT